MSDNHPVVQPRRRILMVATVHPFPANTGGLIRIQELAKGLARHHDVTLVCPASATGEGEGQSVDGVRLRTAPATRPGWVRRLRGLLSREPYHVTWYRNPALDELVRTELATGGYDLLYVHLLRSLQHVPGDAGVPIVLDQQNVDREMWRFRLGHDPDPLRRLVSRRILAQTVRYEREWSGRVAAYVSVSEDDAAMTRDEIAAPGRPVVVAPNGVDTDAITPGSDAPRAAGEPTIGYLGSMDLPANIEAVLELHHDIAPAIAERTGPLRLLAVGRRPGRRIRSLKSTESVRVDVTGTVPDVLPYLHEMDVLVAPVRFGGGTKLKVIQAMAAGVPLVLSQHASQGLGLVDGRDALIVDDAAGMAASAASLIEDRGRAAELARSARMVAERLYGWRRITDELAGWLARV